MRRTSKFRACKRRPEAKGNDDSDSSETDTEYAIFLDYLKEVGSSYAFHDSSTYVEYEAEEDSSGDGPQAEAEKRNDYQICGRDCVKNLKLDKVAIDPCYEMFLSHIQVTSGGPFHLKLNDGTPVIKYDRQVFVESEADQTCFWSESESSESSAEIVEGYEVSIDSRMYSDASLFRTRLEAHIAEVQFDEDELQNLLSDARSQTLCRRDKQLRSATKSYATGEMGKSYFDHFPDFRQRVKTACCDVRRFKLLQGFFFWIKNVSHAGAFPPWLDASFVSCPCSI